jgi:hypothetical protein
MKSNNRYSWGQLHQTVAVKSLKLRTEWSQTYLGTALSLSHKNFEDRKCVPF